MHVERNDLVRNIIAASLRQILAVPENALRAHSREGVDCSFGAVWRASNKCQNFGRYLVNSGKYFSITCTLFSVLKLGPKIAPKIH